MDPNANIEEQRVLARELIDLIDAYMSHQADPLPDEEDDDGTD